MNRHKGNTVFGVVGAVRCDCWCLEGWSREIDTNTVCSQVMADLGYCCREFGLYSVGNRVTPSQRRGKF